MYCWSGVNQRNCYTSSISWPLSLSPRTCLFTSSHRPPQRSLFTIYSNFVHFIFWSDLLVSLTQGPTIYFIVRPHCSSTVVPCIDLPERGSRICWAYRKYSWICNIFPHHGVFSGSAEETDHCSCWHRGFYRWETFKAGGLIMVGWYVECVCVCLCGRGGVLWTRTVRIRTYTSYF